ncbi:MAG: tol-pal system protein YbgF [Pseudomonadota bacterium]
MHKAWLIVPLTLILGGCLETLNSVSTAEDPTSARLAEIERRLASLERVVRNQSAVQMSQQLDALERRVDALQGTTEELQFDAGTTSERQRDLYADLDERIQALTDRLRDSPTTAAPADVPLVTTGSDRDNYQAAFQLLRDQQYDAAAAALERFLTIYPDSELAANAQYWLAETYYVTQKYDQALAAFSQVINGYPDSNKVSDALLKTGFSFYELKRWDDARAALAQVRSGFPESTAARLAAQRLERMAAEGV